MDKVTLAPDEDGYSFKDGIETVRAQLSGGQGRYRMGTLNATLLLGVQWTCDANEYEYLRTAYRTHVGEGHAPFPIDLYIDTATLVEHRVRIVPGSFGLSSQSGQAYVVTATLEVLPTRKATSDTPLAKLLMPPGDGYSFTDQAEAIQVETRGGFARVRRDQIGASTKIAVSWRTNAAGYLYLRNFYRAWVVNPTGFAMDLIIDNAAPEEFTGVQFIPGSMGLDSVNGETFEVSATIEVPSDVVLAPPPAEGGIGWFEPVTSSVAFETADPENEGTLTAEFFGGTLYGGIWPWVEDGATYVFTVSDWEPVLPGGEPPTITGDTPGAFQINPAVVEFNVSLGVASITATRNGSPIPNRLQVSWSAGEDVVYANVEYLWFAT